jgi:hypothetical protein
MQRTAPLTLGDLQVPIKTFITFDFKDCVVNLLSHPEYEDIMVAAWTTTPGDNMCDIFDSEILQNFEGPMASISVLEVTKAVTFSCCVSTTSTPSVTSRPVRTVASA